MADGGTLAALISAAVTIAGALGVAIRWSAGIIADDRQIEDWDGSRRLIDAANPRVEIYITLVGDAPARQERLL